MRIVSLVCCLVFVLGGTYAQSSEETLFNRKNIRLSGNWVGLNYQFANFTEDEWTLMRGASFCFEFNRELSIGWGRYSSREEINLVETDPAYSFRYSGLIIAVAPASTRWIHPRFGLTAGTAKIWRTSEEGDDRLFIFQPQLGLEMNVFQFARLGIEGGYRFAGRSNTYDLAGEDLATPFIQAEIRLGISWSDD